MLTTKTSIPQANVIPWHRASSGPGVMEWIMTTLAPASVGFATGLLLTATVCALVWAHVKKRKMRRKILSGSGGVVTVAQNNGDPQTRQHQQEQQHQHHQHHRQELPAPPPHGPTPPEGLPPGASQPQRRPTASGWPRGADNRDGLGADELAEARAGETWRGSWGPLGDRVSGAGLGGVVASGARSVASTRRSSLAGQREASARHGARGSPGPWGGHGNRGHGGTTVAAEASSSVRSQGPDRWARWVDAGGPASGQEWIGAGSPGDSERGGRWREARGGEVEVENFGGHGSLRGHRGGAGDFAETRRARGVGIHRTPSQTGLEFV
ncbi:unnamed protein product [Lampetra fluviatilis]